MSTECQVSQTDLPLSHDMRNHFAASERDPLHDQVTVTRTQVLFNAGCKVRLEIQSRASYGMDAELAARFIVVGLKLGDS